MTGLPGWRLKLLRHDPDFVLYRGRKDDPAAASVLIRVPALEYPASSTIERLHHEYSLRDMLESGWAAKPLALEREGGRTILVLEDPGGEPLDRILRRRLGVGRVLRIAIGIAVALGRMHAANMVHKNIEPANILVDPADGRAWLTGFGIASPLPREHRLPDPPEVVAGTLAYMAPEQTGRMNRSIDTRSDLYSFGVTLYEMLTGSLPFSASDPLEWAHCHVAKQAAPPSEVERGVPEPLSGMVMKLLAKTAEDRYQTAGGVEVDLRRGLAEWEASGRIAPFALGGEDISDRLLIPEQLYGREHECQALLDAFQRVVQSGTPEFVLVSGYAGVGKSTLVNELNKVIVLPRGIFLSGKFDRFKGDVPYASLAQAFQTLVRQILVEPEDEVRRWSERVRQAVHPNGQLLADLIPELELVIGRQPPVAELLPREAENRFHAAFRRFLCAVADRNHPLVLFIDDLQWLDIASLKLLKHLILHPEVRYLLLIGAYRHSEVSPSHPLMVALEDIRAGATIHEIFLPPLGAADVAQLIADALHCDRSRAEPLARLVHEKTAGNPFFVIQFLTMLCDEGLLAFDGARRAWTWDVDRIASMGFTDNVVDLVVGKLQRLSAVTQEALRHLACLGYRAEASTLALALNEPEGKVQADLWKACQVGLVLRRGSLWKFPHDRIAEATYALIPESLRAGMHLRIGRLLRLHLPDEGAAVNLFDIAGQLNRGAALISDWSERVEVAALNLRAGRKAKASNAFRAAAGYFAAGAAMLGDEGWEQEHELAFALSLEWAECEFLAGDVAEAEPLVSVLRRHGRGSLDRAAVHRVEIGILTTKGDDAGAIDSALECLRTFGIDIPTHPSAGEVEEAYQEVWRTLGDRRIEDLVDLPLMTDAEMKAALDVLASLYAPAYHRDNNLFYLHLCHGVNISLAHGNAPASTHAYGWFGVMLATTFHRPDDGYRFTKLAYDLMERHEFLPYKATAAFLMRIICYWTQTLDLALDYSRTAFDAAVETGDVPLACFGCNHTVMLRLLRGDPLSEVLHEVELALDFVRKARFRDVEDMIVGIERFARAMRGETRNLSSYDDDRFSEAGFEAELARDRMPTLLFYYNVLKLMARYLSTDYAAALAAGETCKALLWAGLFSPHGQCFHYYHALTLAAEFDRLPPGRQPEALQEVAAHREALRQPAETNPPAFLAMYALVSAELARMRGSAEEAMRLYEEAIRAAANGGFVQDEGLAWEVAARFHRARGFEAIADLYLWRARACYERWGGTGKVAQLDDTFPRLREQAHRGVSPTIGVPVEQLDLMSVVKASQTVSGEIVLDKLVASLMGIMVEHAGADRGLLLLPHGGTYRIEAEVTVDRERVEVVLGREAATPEQIPEFILRYVVRTRKSVILGDAAVPNPFSADPFLARRHVRSVLCLPLLKQARLTGALYLENSLTPCAFTPARVAVLDLLAAQAAISLENARLYADLTQENHERQRVEEALREREARIRRLVDSNIIGIFFWKLSGEILDANDAFLAMIGYSRHDLLSGNVNWSAMTPPEYRPADERAAAEIRSSGRCRPIEKEYIRKDGRRIPVLLAGALFEGSEDQGIAFVVDLTERKQAEERQKLLLHELNHRVKNTLAAVSAIAVQTLRTAETPEAFVNDFEARLLALSQAHNLLAEANWLGASLRDILQLELAPFAAADTSRFVLSGPDVHLNAKATVTLGMVFHELATNAAKYGALSQPSGRVELFWDIEPLAETGRRLHVEWRESGGPRVQPPRRKGFGLRLVETGLGAELGSRVNLDFAPDGVRCVMDLPTERVFLP